jgi:GT2 family glycosyltransferase
VEVDFSIVVPSHQRWDMLRSCLAAVVQHAPEHTEILVVDDGSPRAIATSVAQEFKGVRTIALSPRAGFCTAANRGISAARGRIIEILNDDALVTPGWAEPALACFADSSVGAVAPLVLCHAEAIVDSAGDRYYLGGIAGKRGHRKALGPEHLKARTVFGASASSAFYRRDALLRVGAFPESFGAYFEDVDLSFRLHRGGFRILFEPASRVYHHVSSSYGRPSHRLLEQQSQNEERVFWRNLPTGSLLRVLPRHLAVLAAKAGRRYAEGNLRPFLCGRLRLLGEIGDLLRHRRRLNRLGPAAVLSTWEVESCFWGGQARHL